MLRHTDLTDTSFVERLFTQQGITIDGFSFVKCRFERCKLIFKGNAPVSFSGCTFVECQWSFQGAAENTLQFLADIFRGLGEEGQVLVESVFEGVRRGDIRNTQLPLFKSALTRVEADEEESNAFIAWDTAAYERRREPIDPTREVRAFKVKGHESDLDADSK